MITRFGTMPVECNRKSCNHLKPYVAPHCALETCGNFINKCVKHSGQVSG